MDLQRLEIKSNSDSQSGYSESRPKSFSDEYELLREIGHGSQGKVFLAKRRSDGKQVSVKKLDISSVKTWKEYTLFKREGDVLKSLNIDGVARCYETLEYLNDDSPCAYIVQDYIYGKSMQALLNEGKRFEVGVFYDIVLQLLTILEQLHQHEPCVIHRDIKPSNIVLEPKQGGYKVWLIDFGAVANPQIQRGGSTVAGTYGYMAPEQLMGNPEPASDIYSLGAVIVHVLSGVSPAQMLNRDFRLMFEPELQNLHPSVVKILRQMLEPDAHKRLSDISLLRKAFSSFSLKQYDLDDACMAVQKVCSAEQYNKQLTKVSAYGAAGNIELWSQLSDNAPRKIPKCYQKKVYNVAQIESKSVKRRVNDGSFKNISINLFLNIWNAVKLFVSLIRLLIILLFVSFIFVTCLNPMLAIITIPCIINETRHNKKMTSIVCKSLIPLACVFYITLFGLLPEMFCNITTLIILMVLYYAVEVVLGVYLMKNVKFGSFFDMKFRPLKESKKSIAIDSWFEAKYLCDLTEINRLINKLLVSGRKTIARVVSVEYIRCPSELVLEAKDMLADNPVFFGVPTFKVSYSFNPPDDLREEDLLHSFETHTDPSELLQVGDPLPILYDIERNDIEEVVVSVPFPLVLDDPVTARDVVCKSIAIRTEEYCEGD